MKEVQNQDAVTPTAGGSAAETFLRRAGARFCAVALMLLVLMGLAPSSHAVIDTNISGIITDLTTFFGNVQTLVIAVVVFGLAIGFVKIARKK